MRSFGFAQRETGGAFRRAEHWPEPLAKQVAKAARAEAEAGLDFSRIGIVSDLRFNCKKLRRK